MFIIWYKRFVINEHPLQHGRNFRYNNQTQSLSVQASGLGAQNNKHRRQANLPP
jgi:hypothetical protein